MAVKPIMAYVGGKRWAAKSLVSMLKPHNTYVEVFAGMAAVLLEKTPSKVEVYNDIDAGLATVFRVTKYHPDELARELNWMLLHRSERLAWLANPGETDIQRAARWLAVRWSGFSNLPGRGFFVSKSRAAVSRDTLIENIMAVSKRFARVHVESQSWEKVIARYDAPNKTGRGTVFFLDPPYMDGDQTLYANPFDEAAHKALRERLYRVQGDWVLTYGDHPLIRKLYANCRIEERVRRRGINQAASKPYKELIITP